MRRHFRNGWSAAAACMLAIAHQRTPMTRWAFLIALVLLWAGAGFVGWYGWPWAPTHPIPWHEAVYRTISALSMSDDYTPKNEGALNIARFAGVAFPVFSLVFAFWGQLGRSIAHGLFSFARNHIVIAGAGPAAVFLAQDCRANRNGRDSVVLIGAGLPEDLSWALSRNGVYVINGSAVDRRTLTVARAHRGAHVVAFEDDDTANLQIEAAMRGLIGKAKRKTPISVHVATRSPMLLREARAMRASEQAKRGEARPSIESKPFSLEEIAARRLIQGQTIEILDVAKDLGQPRVHIVLFGFDEAAQAVAAHVFMSLWSAHFEAPRVTVLAPDPDACLAQFRSRHPQAFAHPQLWAADIKFLAFDMARDHIDHSMLQRIQVTEDRGQATAVVVSAGTDPDNIRLSLALKRACNEGLYWPAPIYMKESARSEFSAVYAKGDETPERDAYLLAFGGLQTTATRLDIIMGRVDQGAAIAHAHYQKGFAREGRVRMQDLQAVTREWGDVLETFRAANRAVADSAMVKVWDAGWRPMQGRQSGETEPEPAEGMGDLMARREHDRWMAERLMAGWRPVEEGGRRDNSLLIHDKLIPWDQLSEADKKNDDVQVRASIDIARAMHPRGFEARA